ncbi:histidine kinase [Streptomyces avidinii]|uniref:sensor histidine kinase n=1 Tax=Streptomyces avidinii TaxID=1895 RepID=UPI00386E39D1|nr:histidine kinase [Streptomyces avidinii]
MPVPASMPSAPDPPLMQRLPRAARAAVTGCMVAVPALLLYAAIAGGAEPSHAPAAEGAALAAGVVAVAAVVMAAPLAWARSRPSAALGLLLVEAAASTAAGLRAEQVWPLFPVTGLLAAAVAATRTPRAGLVAALATGAVQETVLQVDLFRDGGWGRVLAPGFIGLTACLALLVMLAWLSGTYVRQRRAYGEALRSHAATQAVTAERLRIAREIHDLVAHGIGVIAIQAGAGKRVIDSEPERARGALTAIETTSRETLRGLRTMLDILRRTEPESASVAEAEPFLGLAALDRLVTTTADAGVHVEVRHCGERRELAEAVDRSAIRIVQESLTNVVRHANAGHCRVTVDWGFDDLSVEIVDDGPDTQDTKAPLPEAEPATGYGIRGMQERVALLAGDFTAGPRPEGGFRVAARFPLPTTEAR